MDSTTVATVVLLTFIMLTAETTYRYGRRDILHPIVLVNGIMAFYVLVPAAWLLYTGLDAFPDRFDILSRSSAITLVGQQTPSPSHALATALATALAALGGMYLIILGAYWCAERINFTDRLTTSGDSTLSGVNSRLLLILGVVGFIIGVVSYAVYIHLNGGIIRALTVAHRTNIYHVPNTLRYKRIGMFGVFGGYATILCALRPAIERWRVRQSDASGILRAIRSAAIIAVVTVIAFGVAVSTRARMVMLVPLCILIVYIHTAGWLSRRTVVGVGAVVITIGLSFSLIEATLLGRRSGIALSALFHSAIHMSRFALMMVLVKSVPGEVGYQFGATLPYALPINPSGFPRYGDLLERIATGVDKQYHTSSAMLPGELWLNFGPVGLAVGGLIYGAALRWTYRLRKSASVLVRGAQPAVFVSVLLLWPTNLAWGIPRLFFRFLVPVAVALVVAIVVQRWLPSLARTLGAQIEDG